MPSENNTLPTCRDPFPAPRAARRPNTTPAPFWEPSSGSPALAPPGGICPPSSATGPHLPVLSPLVPGRRVPGELAPQIGLRLGPRSGNVLVDGTSVKVHQHGTGPPKGDAATPDASRGQAAIGVIRGGLTTKIAALTDKVGRLGRFVLTPGNACEPAALPTLLDGVRPFWRRPRDGRLAVARRSTRNCPCNAPYRTPCQHALAPQAEGQR